MKQLSFIAVFVLALLASLETYAAESAFLPGGSTVSLAVTGTTSRVAVGTTEFNPNIRFYNSGSVAVFVACGDVTIVATTAAGMPLAPGTVEVITCPAPAYVAGISAGTAATLYMTPGNGI